MSEPRPPRRGLHELDEETIWAAILICGAALFRDMVFKALRRATR